MIRQLILDAFKLMALNRILNFNYVGSEVRLKDCEYWLKSGTFRITNLGLMEEYEVEQINQWSYRLVRLMDTE